MLSLTDFKRQANDNIDYWKYLIRCRTAHKIHGEGVVIDVRQRPGYIQLQVQYDEALERSKIRKYDTAFFQDNIFTKLIPVKELMQFLERTKAVHQKLEAERIQAQENEKRKHEQARANLQPHLDRIVQLIRDYWAFQNEPITSERIEAWIDQFPFQEETKKTIFLKELEFLFTRYYFSQAQVYKYFRQVFTSQHLFGEEIEKIIRKINFLDIQRYGQSQSHTVKLVDQILQENYGFGVRDCGGGSIYYYMDDCLFSGNRLMKDFEAWVEELDGENADFYILYFAVHLAGRKYAFQKMGELLENKNTIFRTIHPHITLDNTFEPKYHSAFWPQTLPKTEAVSAYYAHLRKQRMEKNVSLDFLRPEGIPHEEELSSSPDGRNLLEGLFVQVGADILAHMNQCAPKEEIRPLGFDKLHSFGFGSPVITYRNIANNCPLAFWFDGNQHGHPWRPLFQRRTNRPDLWWF